MFAFSHRAKLLTLLCFLMIGAVPTAVAGSADAIIKGETSSKRTSFELHIHEFDTAVEYLKLTIDGKSYELTNTDQYSTRSIYDPEIGVYVILVEGKDVMFKFWMVPSSWKVLDKGNGRLKATFAAKIEASDPREPAPRKWKTSPQITIGCTLNYQI